MNMDEEEKEIEITYPINKILSKFTSSVNHFGVFAWTTLAFFRIPNWVIASPDIRKKVKLIKCLDESNWCFNKNNNLYSLNNLIVFIK